MPDQTLQIDVKTTADLSGLQSVRTQINGINADIQKQLAAAGAVFDPVSQSFKSIAKDSSAAADAAKGAADATKGIGDWSIFAGAQLSKAKGEATVLARELATGSFNARTLGALLGSLGTPITLAAIAGIGLFQAIKRASDEQDKWVKEVLRTTEEMRKLGQEILNVDAALRNTALIKELPLGAGLKLAQQEVIRLKSEQDLLDLSTKEGLEEYEKYSKAIRAAQDLVDRLLGSQQRQTDAVQQTTDQIALNRAYGNEELTIQLKVKQVYDAKLRSLREAHVPEALARDLATETAESERQKLEAIRGQADPQSHINALLREQATILQGIHQQEELIREHPFLSIDAKQNLLVQLYTQQMAVLQEQIARDTLEQSKFLQGTPQWEQLRQKIQAARFEVELLGIKTAGLKLPLRTELANWVNSFGDASHQIATTIEGSINAALQGTNQLLLDAAFRTGNWKQTLQGVERQILNLFLTWLEQMALQQAASLLGITTTTSKQVASGAAITAAHAPAAAATSISSGGLLALLGEAAAIAAIVAIMAAFKMHEGGPMKRRRMHSGGLAPDEVPIIAQEGEFMIQRSVAESPGMMDFLMALNAGMLFHWGGRVRRLHTGGGEFGWSPGDIWGPDWSGGFVPPFAEPTPIPGSEFNDPFSAHDPEGPIWRDYGDFARSAYALGIVSGFGLSPSFGFSAFGPTMLPTYWVNYPGVGNVPMAVPVGGWQPTTGSQNYVGSGVKPFHLGGPIARVPRLHSGGSLGAGAGTLSSRSTINIYAFTDLREVAKHMASHHGRNIIFETIRGRRIDLGI